MDILTIIVIILFAVICTTILYIRDERTKKKPKIRVDSSEPSRKFFETHKDRMMLEYNKLTPYVNGRRVRVWKYIGHSNEFAMYVPMFYRNDRKRVNIKDDPKINYIGGFPSKLDYPYET